MCVRLFLLKLSAELFEIVTFSENSDNYYLFTCITWLYNLNNEYW